MKKFKSIFRLFITYAFCIVIPIISIVVLGNMLIQDYRKNIILSKQGSIEKAFEKVQNEIEDLENVADYIGKSDAITSYMYDAMKDNRYLLENYQEIIEMFRLFKTGRDVAEIYLFDSRQNRIITTSSAFSTVEHFFRYRYCIEKFTEEHYERISDVSAKMNYSPVMTVVINGYPVQVMEGKVTIPADMVKNYPLQLIIAIEAESIFRDLYDVLEEDSEFNIYNENDELIFSSGECYESVMDLSKEQKLTSVQNGNGYVYGTVLISANGQFKLEMYMPDLKKWLGGEFSIPKVGLLAVGFIAISMFFCAYVTLKYYHEIQDLMRLFVRWNEKGNEERSFEDHVSYETIKKYVDKLVNESIAYKEQTERFNELKRRQILNKLIYEETGERINQQIEDELGIRDDRNIVLCIRYGNSDYRKFITTDVTIKDVVYLFLKENVDREIEIFDTSARETVCIVFDMEEELINTLIRGVITSLYGEIYRELGIKVMVGVGNIAESIYDIGISYRQAKGVIHYQNVIGKNVFLYSEMVQFTDDYYYPQEFDEKLCNYMLAGKGEDAKELVKRIYEKNISKCTQMITISAWEHMKSRLLDTLASLGGSYDISTENAVSQLKLEQEAESFFAMFNDFLDIFAEEISRKERNFEEGMTVKVMDYLKLNYMDSDLSVSKISEQLGYQKDYMSKMFKAEYGENLSVTIEKFRIEKACDLLKGDLKITDIPKEVGYNSDMSFRRAFKKVTGLTPIEYKKVK